MAEQSPSPAGKRVFICADHGMAIVYFMQSDVVPTLLDAGLEVILLTDDSIEGLIAERFGRPGLIVEGLRLDAAAQYAQRYLPRWQSALAYLRRVGGSWSMNHAAMDSHIWEVWAENSWKFRVGIWLPTAIAVLFLRTFRFARKLLMALQIRVSPIPGLYGDLFEKYEPSLVIASTAGWRLDRYLLREAGKRSIPCMSAIVGWDNPSSYAIPGAKVQWASCWSELQKQELVRGSDWPAGSVNIGGMPSYDGYIRRTWLIPRGQYFERHKLDPSRKLVSYACSFVHFAPNLPNVEALAQLISSEALCEPAQLLVRLHPSHYQEKPAIFAEEGRKIRELAMKYRHVHIVQPVPFGGSLGYYSGEDMDEKSSMMEYSDVIVTVYSTMLVETAIHDTPLIAAVFDEPGGWNTPKKYSLSLQRIGNWPTHRRFREAKAGRVAGDTRELTEALNFYLRDPAADGAERRRFVEREITYTDGTAGKRTAEFVLKVLAARRENT